MLVCLCCWHTSHHASTLFIYVLGVVHSNNVGAIEDSFLNRRFTSRFFWFPFQRRHAAWPGFEFAVLAVYFLECF